MAETARRENSIQLATPARAAFAVAASMAPASRSEAIIGGRDARPRVSTFSNKDCHKAASKLGQSMKEKWRAQPGGMLRAIIAASIAMVPEPRSEEHTSELQSPT